MIRDNRLKMIIPGYDSLTSDGQLLADTAIILYPYY